MKINKRLTIKGDIDFGNDKISTYNKDGEETSYSLESIFEEFEGLEDVTLTLSHDRKNIM